MTIEKQIAALIERAEPLRGLPEEEQGDLPAIVDKINALRAIQATARDEIGEAIAEAHEAEFVAIADEVNPPAKRRGRPPKVVNETV
jgi:hypothetical protein